MSIQIKVYNQILRKSCFCKPSFLFNWLRFERLLAKWASSSIISDAWFFIYLYWMYSRSIVDKSGAPARFCYGGCYELLKWGLASGELFRVDDFDNYYIKKVGDLDLVFVSDACLSFNSWIFSNTWSFLSAAVENHLWCFANPYGLIYWCCY